MSSDDRSAQSNESRRYSPRRKRQGFRLTLTTKIFLSVVVLLVGGALVSYKFDNNVNQRFQFSLSGAPLGSAGLSTPTLSSSKFQEASWYCTWSLPSSLSISGATLNVANASSRTAEVSAYTSLSGPPVQQFSVTAWSSLNLPLKKFSKGSTGGVTLVTRDGRTLATVVISSGSQSLQAACQPTPGFFWLANDLYTLTGDHVGLSVYNPFTSDAVVDVYAITDQGISSPGSYQGLIVPAGKTIRLSMRSLLTPTQGAAVEIRARSGRVVMSAIQSRADQLGSGVTFPLVTTRPSPSWQFPYVATVPGSSASVVLTNPSARVVTVDLSVTPYSSTSPLTTNSGVDAVSTKESIEVAPASVVDVPLGSQLKTPASGAFLLRIFVRDYTGIAASVSSILPTTNEVPVFTEPPTTPLSARNWVITEPKGSTSDSSAFGKLALAVGSSSSNLVTISDRSINAQVTHQAIYSNALLPFSGVSKDFNLVTSGVLTLSPPTNDGVYFINSNSSLAVEPAYSPASSGSFLAIPVRK